MCRDLFDRVCAEGGFSPTVAFEADNFQTIGRLVGAGIAVALVPLLAADQLHDDVTLRPFASGVNRRVSVVYRQGAAPSVEKMIIALREASPTPPVH